MGPSRSWDIATHSDFYNWISFFLLKMNDIEKQIAAAKEQVSILHRQRDAAQLERAKSYADAFIRKLEASDIPLKVGLQAFRDLSKLKVSKVSS